MAGSRERSSGSMPCRMVTSARLQPWQPPSSRIRIHPLAGAGDGHVTAVGGDRRVHLRVDDGARGLGQIPGGGGGGPADPVPGVTSRTAVIPGTAARITASMREASGNTAPGDPVTSRVTTPSRRPRRGPRRRGR